MIGLAKSSTLSACRKTKVRILRFGPWRGKRVPPPNSWILEMPPTHSSAIANLVKPATNPNHGPLMGEAPQQIDGGSATTTDPSEVQQRCKTQNVTKGNGRRDRTECQQESPNGLKMPLSCCKKQQTYLLRDSSSNSWQDQDVPNSHCIMCHTEYSMISPSQDVDSKNHCHPSLQG